LLVATEFVFRCLAIHPFQESNARFGCVLLLLPVTQGENPALRVNGLWLIPWRQRGWCKAIQNAFVSPIAAGLL
jgi:hypothetical protein